MANHSSWTDIKNQRPAPSAETSDAIEQDLVLGQLIYDLRTQAGLSQRELAQRMGTTQSVISRLEEGGAPGTASTPSPASPTPSAATSSSPSPPTSPTTSTTPSRSTDSLLPWASGATVKARRPPGREAEHDRRMACLQRAYNPVLPCPTGTNPRGDRTEVIAALSRPERVTLGQAVTGRLRFPSWERGFDFRHPLLYRTSSGSVL